MTMAGGAPDGTLASWADVADEAVWEILLLGNGLSINVWPPFGYRSLLDQAAHGYLTDEDKELFADTTNFERVLNDLNTAIRVCDVAGLGTDPLYERYRSIQRALGQAVREVHLSRTQTPDDTLDAIRETMLEFEWIFTTSYDLLAYWAMGRGHRSSFTPFIDLMRYAGRCEFDPFRCGVRVGEIPIYYLHGALHLVVGGTGKTWKRRQTSQTLLDQFGQPIAGDPQARALLVTEGSARHKLQAIESNDYLTHALNVLSALDTPLVVFGSSLGRQDDHLADAISQNPNRPVAVSMVKKPQRELLAEQSDIWRRVQAGTMYFFDAATHPLGSPDLTAQ